MLRRGVDLQFGLQTERLESVLIPAQAVSSRHEGEREHTVWTFLGVSQHQPLKQAQAR